MTQELKFKNFPKNVKVRLLCSFLTRLTTNSVIPFIAIFFSNNLGMTFVGIFLALTALLRFLSIIIGGYLTEVINRRKIFLIGQVSNALCFLGMAIFAHEKIFLIEIICMFFLINSMLGNLHRSSLDILIMESTSKINRKAVFKFDYWLTNISLTIGLLLGSLFFEKHQFELFLTISIASLITTIVFLLFIEDNTISKKKKINIKDFLNNYGKPIRDKNWMFFIFSGILIFSVELSLGNYIAVRLYDSFENLKIFSIEIDGLRMLSILIIINSLLVVFLTFAINKAVKRFSEKYVFSIGLILNVIFYGLLSYSTDFVILILAMIIVTVGELMYAPIRHSRQYELIPNESKGAYLALGAFTVHGANIIASLGVTLGAWLNSEMMSIYIIISGLIGAYLAYRTIYIKKP